MDVNSAKNVAFYVKNRGNFRGFLMSNPHQFTQFSSFYVYFTPKPKLHKNNKNVLFHGTLMYFIRLNLQDFLPVHTMFMRFLTSM